MRYRQGNCRFNSRAGFTLIELSIVLVIIGLIVGGVLVGRDLIYAARIRSQVTQLSKFNVAVNTFYGKYGTVPGDLLQRDVIKFGFTDYTYAYGDGNGIVNDNLLVDDTTSWADEPVMFFSQLGDAKLTEAYTYRYPNPGMLTNPRSIPALKLNEGAGMLPVTFRGKTWMFLGVANIGTATLYLPSFCSPALKPIEARDLDAKIDDGIPGTGNVLATGVPVTSLSGTSVTQLDTTAAQCVTDSSATAYNVSSSQLWCSPLIKVQ